MKVSLEQFKEDMGFSSTDELIESLHEQGIITDSVVPALCDEDCEVEPDGICPHGGESVLLAVGLI